MEFRLRNVRAGVALSVFCCSYLLVYIAVTWSHPHRDVLLGVCVYSIVTSLGILRLPLDGVMRHPFWREAFFMGWSCLLIVFVTVIVLIDGGYAGVHIRVRVRQHHSQEWCECQAGKVPDRGVFEVGYKRFWDGRYESGGCGC